MSVHTYPLYSVLGDYIRAVLGVAVSAVPLIFISSRPLITYIFWGLIVVFSGYGLRTLTRHLTRIEATDEGVVANGPIRKAFAWRELSKLRLKYFSTKRDKSNGWLQLEMTGNGRRIDVDSSISGFNDMVARATDAATVNGIALDEASIANIASIKRVDGEAFI